MNKYWEAYRRAVQASAQAINSAASYAPNREHPRGNGGRATPIDETSTAQREFRVERFEHSLNISAPRSDLRVQIQLDPRYEAFLTHIEEREILGERLPVARIQDVLQDHIWAVLDETRRASRRQKDLADIARLLEAQPALRAIVPQAVLDRLL